MWEGLWRWKNWTQGRRIHAQFGSGETFLGGGEGELQHVTLWCCIVATIPKTPNHQYSTIPNRTTIPNSTRLSNTTQWCTTFHQYLTIPNDANLATIPNLPTRDLLIIPNFQIKPDAPSFNNTQRYPSFQYTMISKRRTTHNNFKLCPTFYWYQTKPNRPMIPNSSQQWSQHYIELEINGFRSKTCPNWFCS